METNLIIYNTHKSQNKLASTKYIYKQPQLYVRLTRALD